MAKRLVTATATGYYKDCRRYRGETFEMEIPENGKLPSWVTPAKVEVAKANSPAQPKGSEGDDPIV